MLRRAEVDDAAQIAALEREYIEVAWSEKQIEESMRSGLYDFFVWEECGRVVSYGFVQWASDEGNICNIATENNFRHRGLGRGILDIIGQTAIARGVHALFLEVNQLNEGALALYKSAGFKEIYRRANYYGNQAAIVMEKIL